MTADAELQEQRLFARDGIKPSEEALNHESETALDNYDGFDLNAGHTVNDWLPLSPGATILFVTVAGGNADVSVEFYPAWP